MAPLVFWKAIHAGKDGTTVATKVVAHKTGFAQFRDIISFRTPVWKYSCNRFACINLINVVANKKSTTVVLSFATQTFIPLLS